MKVAIHMSNDDENPDTINLLRELAQRSNLDVQVLSFTRDIKRFEPDVVLVLAGTTPRLTRFPTYAYVTKPPADDFEEIAQRNLLSCNGYICAQAEGFRWLQDCLFSTGKDSFIEPFNPADGSLNQILQTRSLIAEADNSEHSQTPFLGKTVELIMRVGGRFLEMIERALDSVARQTFPNVGVIVVRYKDVIGLDDLLSRYRSRMLITVVESRTHMLRSTQLWDGLHSVTADYFGILDDDDLIHPNHIETLMRTISKSGCLFAHSAAIRIWEPAIGSALPPEWQNRETADLFCFNPASINNMMACRNELVTTGLIGDRQLLSSLPPDPKLALFEDLALLLFLLRETRFCFTHEATCEVYWRIGGGDNSPALEATPDPLIRKRIEQMLKHQSFPSAQTVNTRTEPRLVNPLTSLLKQLRLSW